MYRGLLLHVCIGGAFVIVSRRYVVPWWAARTTNGCLLQTIRGLELKILYLPACSFSHRVACFRDRVLLPSRFWIVWRQQCVSSGLCLPDRNSERNLDTLLIWILLSRWHGFSDGEPMPHGLLRPCWCVIVHALPSGAVWRGDRVDDTDVQWTLCIGLHLYRRINVCQPCKLVRRRDTGPCRLWVCKMR